MGFFKEIIKFLFKKGKNAVKNAKPKITVIDGKPVYGVTTSLENDVAPRKKKQ